MAEVISLVGSLKAPCRFHESEFYRFFCKNCYDFVCLTCLDEHHVDHSFCRLESAGNIALEFLSSKVTDVQGIVNRLDKKMAAFEYCLSVISDQICQHADLMKVEIGNSKEHLLASVKDSVKTFIDSANKMKIWVGNLLENICILQEKEVGIEGKLPDILKLFLDFKHCSEGCNKIISQHEPSFQPSLFFSVGNFGPIADVKKKINSSKVDVSTQTFDDNNENEFEDEWYDAEDLGADDVIENSSDALESENLEYPLTIKLAEDIKLVTKILPLSEQDAWILADRKLRKICDNNLSDKIYADNIDDIAVLENGCVLMLTKENKTIQKLLPREKILTFAVVEAGNLLPYCLCTSFDKQMVIIYLFSKYVHMVYINQKRTEQCENCIVAMTLDGVVKKKWSRYHAYCLTPHLVFINNEDLYVVFSKDSLQNTTMVTKLTSKSKFANHDIQFNGAIGVNPSQNFKSYGIWFDRCLIVSDYQNHSVYTLDDELKFCKCVVGAMDGLDHPAAIASKDGFLWVADGNKILRFKN